MLFTYFIISSTRIKLIVKLKIKKHVHEFVQQMR